MTNLLNRHCTPLEGCAPMNAVAINAHLQQVTGWQAIIGAIERSYRFTNFHETMAFVNALAWICHGQDHHPELVVGYNRCAVRFSTHSVGGVSVNDFICAAKVNALVDFVE